MAALTLTSSLTYADYLLLPEDGKRHELIDGEHWMSPAPGTRHQTVSMNLAWLLRSFLAVEDLGQLLAAPCDVVLADETVVQPDLLFVSRDRREIVRAAGVFGSPDLVVEILSEGTRQRDLTLKRKLYERFEVGEYWVVDPAAEQVEVYRSTSAGGFAPAVRLSREAGDRLQTPLLPGLALPLAQVFA